MKKAIELETVRFENEVDTLALTIADMWDRYNQLRDTWLREKREIRDFVFAVDTRKTSTSHLPWKNSVHIPKLCQIRDNLHANYMATLFPNDNAIEWEGDDESAEALKKRLAIKAYISNKNKQSKFRDEIQKCTLDWIDYGNTFAKTEYVHDTYVDDYGETVTRFIGPRVVRISPLDIVFNPTANSFYETPKIIRTLYSLADLISLAERLPEQEETFRAAIQKATETRNRAAGLTSGDNIKNSSFMVDGFGNWLDYFKSGYVEMLDFYGDMVVDGELRKNQKISVVDRSFVAFSGQHPTWLGHAPIFHVGWRLRPDNLYAMGPLDNLVGMQYRIDHLENAKADAYDLIIHPITKIVGHVEEFAYGPNERIYADEGGDVTFLRPDTTMLTADTQIAIYENKMEEMAGAPRQAMGIRSPGEKTAFEVQVLENGSNRVFVNKVSYFEEMFIEPILCSMLDQAARNLDTTELLRVMDDQFGVVDFLSVTKEDLSARGKIRPIGARHFASNANIIQNLTSFANSGLGQDPTITAHISGKAMAKLLERLFGFEKFAIFGDNIRIGEQLETQKLALAAQQIIGETQMVSQQEVQQ